MKSYNVTDVYIKDGNEFEFSYYSNPPMSTKLSFVKSVVDSVVVGDYYYPIIKDMVFDFYLIDFFSDVVIDIETDNVGVDDIEEYLSGNNAAATIKLGMDLMVLNELYDSVDKGIEYKTGIHLSPIADAIVNVLDVVQSKLSGLDVDAMTGMANVFSNMSGNITPEKMLEAYAKSDVFKKQHEDAVANQAKRDKTMDAVRETVKRDTATPVNGMVDNKVVQSSFEVL